MSLDDLLQTIRVRWRAFHQLCWPEGPRAAAEAKIQRLTWDLHRRYQSLVRRRCRIERLRFRLEQMERLRALLLAGRPTPEWERLRRAIGSARDLLRCHEDAYEMQRLRFEQRRRRRDELRMGSV